MDLVFPRRCPVCDRPVRPQGVLACPDCADTLMPVDRVGDGTCRKCGKPLRDPYAEYCYDCRRLYHLFERGIAAYPYRTVSGMMYRFKYGGRREYAAFLAQELEKRLLQDPFPERCDMIIPVPLGRQRLRERGYNQAEALGRALSERIGIPIRNDILFRTKNTAALKNMAVSERQEKLKGAFIAIGNDVKCKIIMLIDDIYTTGTTMDACTAALLSAGARRVYAVAFAVGESGVC